MKGGALIAQTVESWQGYAAVIACAVLWLGIMFALVRAHYSKRETV